MKNKTLIIIVVIVIILLIGLGIYMYIQSKKEPVTIVNPTNGSTTTTDLFSVVSDLFSRLFKKRETLPAFVQTPPIDADGCDANGFNRIGVRCPNFV